MSAWNFPLDRELSTQDGVHKGPQRAGLRTFSSGLLSWDPDTPIPHGCSRHESQLEVLKAGPPEHSS